MSLGFEAAGFDIVAAVELDPVNAATHEYNFPFCPVICADARAVSAEHILRSANLRAGDIDVVFGGPPCQGFSIIGKRSPSDPRNQGLFHFHRIIHELKPRLFVLENVPGLTSLGTHLRRFIAKCRVSGYDIVDPFEVLDAAQYGVPQERRRVFLYGFLDGLAPPKYPTPTHRSRSRSIRNGKNGRGPGHEALPFGPTVSEAIGDLPDVNKIAALRHSESVPWQLESGSEYARRLHGDIADPFDFSYQRIFDKTLLTCSQRIEHSPECRARFRKTRPGSTEPLSRLVKLSADGVSHTLRAGTLPDKGSFMAPRPIHPTSSRCITVREAARLHSYPDWFRFHVTKWHGFRQIGNSVPPLLARAVAATVMKALGATPTKPDHPVELRNQWKLSIAFSKSSVGIAPTRRYAGLRKAKRKHDPK
ncbi:MAG: (cytosine-5-)-methyltransferase [Acidobacteria bacterium]|nr:(cytosine-5-)-methyltransferase [Acidobacteriota bacterium]